MEMKYELGLYEHNAKAYEESKKMLEEENMACIIHATGTGKSYVALQLIYDYIKENNNKRIVFLTPLNGIKDQIKEHIKNSNVPSNFFDNVEFLSYSALLNMTKEEFNNIGFCVCDEFHHVKAPKWKKQIDAMLEQNEDIKVFGMSATSIRGLGTSKEEDVSETFFKGNVASTYTLADAIVDGVLPAPEYHTNLLYLIDSEFPEIEAKLKYGTWSNEEKNAYLSDLNRMRQQLASSDETKDMIKRHVKKDGKYLYFAKKGTNIKELQQEFLSSLPEEYRDNVEFYQVHSTDYAKSANKFSADCFYNNISEQGGKYEIIDGQKVVVGQKNETKLRVMFAIDMYNEGIHVPDLDGVIMGRNTKSDILFYQQLGRALSVKPKSNTSPLILDTVGNIKEIIRLYSTVRQKHAGIGGNPYVVSTTDREHYFRNVFGISQEVVDIVEEFERLKEIINARTELILRIEYVYDTYKDVGLPSQRTSDRFPFGSNAIIGSFLHYDKPKVIEQAKLGNPKAMWIINQLQLRANLTDEEIEVRIEYIYDAYKDKGLPTQSSLDNFPFGSNTNIGNFLSNSKTKIQEQAQLGNPKAKWIINQLQLRANLTDEEIKVRIEYIYDAYKDKGLPAKRSLDKFPFGNKAKIVSFLTTGKSKIQEQAKLGNPKAEWIINKLRAKAKANPTEEEKEEELKARIEYVYDAYKDKGLPTQSSLDNFPFGSNTNIRNFLSNSKTKIQEQAQLGNPKAKWIINKLQAKANPTEEEKEEELKTRIEYVYDTYKDKGLPAQSSLDKFPFGNKAKIVSFLTTGKSKIQEQATLGNPKAKWIINQFQLSANLTDEEIEVRIEYIYDTYKDKGLPTYDTQDEFPFGKKALIGNFLSRNKNKTKIQEQAKLGNIKAEWIINQLQAKANPTEEEKEEEIKAKIEYVYDTYKDKGLPAYTTQDKFPFGNKAKIVSFLYYDKPKVIEQAKLGNIKAEWIINQLQAKAKPTEEEKEEEIKAKIEYIYETYKDVGLSSKNSSDRFPFGSNAKIVSFLYYDKPKVIEQANLGNPKAMWICQQKKWIKIEEAKQEFDQNSNFGELKDILSGKNIDEGKSLS